MLHPGRPVASEGPQGLGRSEKQRPGLWWRPDRAKPSAKKAKIITAFHDYQTNTKGRYDEYGRDRIVKSVITS